MRDRAERLDRIARLQALLAGRSEQRIAALRAQELQTRKLIDGLHELGCEVGGGSQRLAQRAQDGRARLHMEAASLSARIIREQGMLADARRMEKAVQRIGTRLDASVRDAAGRRTLEEAVVSSLASASRKFRP